MKNRICICCIIVFILFMCIACFFNSSKYPEYSNSSKDNHRVTFILTDSLYVEKYTVFSGGGATVSDSYSYYITDSISFRKHIGTEYSSVNRIFWNIKNNNEVEFNFEYSTFEKVNGIPKNIYDTTEIRSYNILALKKEGRFE